MNRLGTSIAIVTTSVLTIVWAGCNSQVSEPSSPPKAAQSADGHDHADHEGHSHSAADMEKVKAELAKLSPEDAASVEKQHVCPVTGEMLGTMGAPLKMEVKGQQVWICCDGCRDQLQADPDKYLAKLKKD